MTINITDDAREWARSGDNYTGPEVRSMIYILCDEIERLHAVAKAGYANGLLDRRDEASNNLARLQDMEARYMALLKSVADGRAMQTSPMVVVAMPSEWVLPPQPAGAVK